MMNIRTLNPLNPLSGGRGTLQTQIVLPRRPQGSATTPLSLLFRYFAPACSYYSQNLKQAVFSPQSFTRSIYLFPFRIPGFYYEC